MRGRCQTEKVIYRATVTESTTGKKDTYIGLTANTFKKRRDGHNTNQRNANIHDISHPDTGELVAHFRQHKANLPNSNTKHLYN